MLFCFFSIFMAVSYLSVKLLDVVCVVFIFFFMLPIFMLVMVGVSELEYSEILASIITEFRWGIFAAEIFLSFSAFFLAEKYKNYFLRKGE